MSIEEKDESQEGVKETSPTPRERVEAADDGFVIDAHDGSDEPKDEPIQNDEGEPDDDPEGDEPEVDPEVGPEAEPEEEPEFDGLNEPEAEAEPEADPDKKPPATVPYGVFSDKVAKKNAKIAALEARLAANQAPQQAQVAAPMPQAAPPEKVPVVDDFESREDYVIAKASYEGRQSVRDEQAKVVAEQEVHAQATRDADLKAEVQVLQSDYDTKVELAKAKNPKAYEDYEDYEDSFRTSGVSPVCIRAVMESSVPAPIVKYLAKNPAEASRIAKLPDVQQAMEIGKLAERASTKPQKNKVSKAPKKINRPKAGGGDTTTQKFEDSMPQGKFEELRTKAKKEGLTPAQMLEMK